MLPLQNVSNRLLSKVGVEGIDLDAISNTGAAINILKYDVFGDVDATT